MLNSVGYATKTFVSIFPTYEDFKSWYMNCPLSDGENDCPSIKTFTLIANEYNDSHSAFDEEGFKQHFANDIYTYYREFEATTKAIIDLINLTDEQIAVADTFIINTANIPEEEMSTDTEDVNFISNQQKNINKKGTLQVKREQLSNKRAFTVKTFLNRFRHLFIRILTPGYVPVIREDDKE